MSFVAVAMASGGADLSDDTGTAVGPATIYAFLGVGGLFNVLLLGDARDPRRGPGCCTLSRDGPTGRRASSRPGFCLDAEVVRSGGCARRTARRC